MEKSQICGWENEMKRNYFVGWNEEKSMCFKPWLLFKIIDKNNFRKKYTLIFFFFLIETYFNNIYIHIYIYNWLEFHIG